MRDCTTCKFDTVELVCKQGHFRGGTENRDTLQIIRVIQNCHAWEERSKCWCERDRVCVILSGNPLYVTLDGCHYQEKVKFFFCPECGRKLG